MVFILSITNIKTIIKKKTIIKNIYKKQNKL